MHGRVLSWCSTMLLECCTVLHHEKPWNTSFYVTHVWVTFFVCVRRQTFHNKHTEFIMYGQPVYPQVFLKSVDKPPFSVENFAPVHLLSRKLYRKGTSRSEITISPVYKKNVSIHTLDYLASICDTCQQFRQS